MPTKEESDLLEASKEALLPEAEAAGLRAGPRNKSTFVQEGEYTPPAPKATPKKQTPEPNRDSEEAIGEQGLRSSSRAEAKTSGPISDSNMAALPRTPMHDESKGSYPQSGSGERNGPIGDVKDNLAAKAEQRAKPRKKYDTGTPGKLKYASGGSVKSSASSRGDGIAQRGKTRGRYI